MTVKIGKCAESASASLDWRGLKVCPSKDGWMSFGGILGEDWVPHCQSIASCSNLLVRQRWSGSPQETAEVTPAPLGGVISPPLPPHAYGLMFAFLTALMSANRLVLSPSFFPEGI